MKRILKYKMEKGTKRISLSKDADILGIQVQGDDAVLYAATDTEGPQVTRAFDGRHTGEVVDPSCHKYVGTAMLADGKYVLHVYEVRSVMI